MDHSLQSSFTDSDMGLPGSKDPVNSKSLLFATSPCVCAWENGGGSCFLF